MNKQQALTQQQFDYIVTSCDEILAQHRSEFAFAGIAFLNVLHSHPSIQERYIHVFHKRGAGGMIKAIIRGAGLLLSDLFLSLFSKSSGYSYQRVPGDTSVLFISHLLNTTTAAAAPDFYFQELPDYLQRKGYPVAVGLMNHVKGFSGWKEKHAASAPWKFLLPRRLDFVNEWKLLRQRLRTALYFFKQYRKEKDPLRKSFLLELSGNTLSAHTLRAYRVYEVVKHLCGRTQIHTVAFTWEGHSWEKMICAATKTTARTITSIGYQHTILFPSSHALKKSNGKDFDVDVIVTVGNITRDILRASPDLSNVRIETYGSPRLTKEPAYKMDASPRRACLVTPEGLVNECRTLFSFAIEAARLMPGIDFIFRNHPSILFEYLQGVEPTLRKLPPNVVLSQHTNIDDDLRQCSWLLYRNSSVSFFAVMAGLRPVYLSLPGEISNDVLYALRTWKKEITHPAELEVIIQQDEQQTPQQRELERAAADQFCRQYMMPHHVEQFDQYINVTDRQA